MFANKECVAMLLAGGQGSRLYCLTEKIAKPAVPFGGKYRIIDFPLSNCVNSDIDTVGVLTQYQPHELNAYIGSGQAWDLDRIDGGVHILPPYIKGKKGTWYKGTANAIYQNMDFIDRYDPEYVLILSGDHIYKFDYRQMIDHHRKNEADCTIAVIEVSAEEASRFGIMNVNSDDTIFEFEEKPKVPKSNLASMGIYVFSWQKLRMYLLDDERDPKSSNDFGANIIPKMLANNEKMMVYRFSGYWKDVGTIESLWEANMDMLSPETGLNLFDPEWRIYAGSADAPPHYCGPDSTLSHSLVTGGCVVYGAVENSVLFHNVKVGSGASIRYSIIMPDAVVEDGAVIEYSIVGERARICKDARVGSLPADDTTGEWGISVVAADKTIGPGRIVAARQMVGEDLL